MKFRLWIERRIVRDAIMGVLGASTDEEADFSSRKTTYFGSDIRKRLKGLGVVKSTNNDRGSYGEIVRAIDDGITIGELIKRVEDAL